MHVLIATPLFPPDTAPSGVYVKNLAEQLPAAQKTVVLYGHLPESATGVTFACVDKRQLPLQRSWQFFRTLRQQAETADRIIIQNGPSVELPALLFSWFTSQPYILSVSDLPAWERSLNSWWKRVIVTLLKKRATTTLNLTAATIPGTTAIPMPRPRPLIHPLHPYPATAIAEYDASWHTHITSLTQFLS